MNSCRFVLNNDSDAFIITPANVCANLNLSGWRVPKDRTGRLADHPGRESNRYDEVAKYQIYSKKYKIVNPTDKNTANIDETGMWLYPLNPYSVIFNKHDPCRVFTRLPYTTGVGRKISGKREGWELWMPCFTGFLRNISWHDDPVEGDRTVSVEAYDYKGLMNRMRVRTQALRVAGGGRDKKRDKKFYGKKKNNKTKNPSLKGGDYWGPIFYKLGLDTLLSELYDIVQKRELLKCTKKQKECLTKADATATTAKDKYVPGVKGAYTKAMLAAEVIKRFTSVDYILGPKGSAGGEIRFYTVQGPADNKKKDGKSIGKKDQKKKAKAEKKKDPKVGGMTQLLAVAKLDYFVISEMSQLITALKKKEIERPLTREEKIEFIKRGFVEEDPAGHIYSHGRIRKIMPSIVEAFGKLTWKAGWPSRKIAFNWYRKEIIKALLAMYRLNRNGSSETMTRINAKVKITTNSADPNSVVTGLHSLSWDKFIAWQEKAVAAVNTVQREISSEVARAKKTAIHEAKKIEADRNRIVQEIEHATHALRDARLHNLGKERRINDLLAKIKAAREAARAKQPRTIIGRKEIFKKEPTFENKAAGNFDDLIMNISRNAQGGIPHPLANMSYEQATEWLICKNSRIVLGVRQEVGKYQEGVMENYNRNACFGLTGRPYTYQEVTLLGKKTTSDYVNDIVAPVNAFYNLLLPSTGTGAATIIQADVSANQLNSIQYGTRLSLMQQISDLLDFQWYISPMGDHMVEMPNYNILPGDFGKTFAGAYRVQLEWKGGDINEEAVDIPTGWIFQGNESEVLSQKPFENEIANEMFKKIAITSPILAMRLGVSVEHVSIDLPGVGGIVGANPRRVALDAIRIYGLVYIQRQLGAAHTLTCSLPFRPYLLPNRPVHIVARQRIGLLDTISFSASPPNGEFTVDVTTKYVRWLHRDGTFRTIAGGYRQPVDYTGFYTGAQGFRVKEGVSANMSHKNPRNYEAGRGVPTTQGGSNGYIKASRSNLAQNCGAALKGAYLDTQNSYGDDLASSFSGSSFIGAKIHRTVSNKGRNEPGKAITTKGTGLRENRKDKKAKKTAPRYDLTKLFHNPYPFGVAKSAMGVRADGKRPTRFNNWYNRYFTSNYLTGYHSGARGGSFAWHSAKPKHHSGIDILMPEGTDIMAPMNSGWVRYSLTVGPFEEEGSPAPTKLLAVKNLKEVRLLKNFAVWQFSVPKVLARHPDGQPSAIRVYKKQYDAWIKSGRKLNVVRSQKGGARGLVVDCFGRVLPPKITNDPALSRAVRSSSTPEGLSAIVTVMHCSDVSKKRGAFIKNAQKGDVVAKVGKTGTRVAHAHVDMYLLRSVAKKTKRQSGRHYPKDYSVTSDDALFRAAAKANQEYMETLALLKITGGKPDSGKISPSWQKYFESRGIKVNSVKEAVDVLYKSNKWFQSNSDPNANKIMTNAFLYFKPNEIVAGATEYDNERDVWYSTSSIEGSGDKTGSSVCGKLPQVEVRKLQVELKACLLKAGKSGSELNQKRVRKCRHKFKGEMIAYQKTVKQIDANNVEKKLAAQTQRTMKGKKNRGIPQTPLRHRTS